MLDRCLTQRASRADLSQGKEQGVSLTRSFSRSWSGFLFDPCLTEGREPALVSGAGAKHP